jgi:hypothetical protein
MVEELAVLLTKPILYAISNSMQKGGFSQPARTSEGLMKNKMCPKCSHYDFCKSPCYPVARNLYERGEPFEKNNVVYPLHKQIPISVCLKESKDGKDSPNNEEKILSDELESPFRHFDSKLKMTGIFIQRFFFRKKFKEIASMYEISTSNARQLYSQAQKTILKNLENLDQDGRKTVAGNHYKKMFQNNAKKIPKNKKYWIMCNYFGLTPSEVAEMEGTTNRNVSSAICKFDQRVRAGKVSF